MTPDDFNYFMIPAAAGLAGLIAIFAGPALARRVFIRKTHVDAPWWEQARALFSIQFFHVWFIVFGALLTMGIAILFNNPWRISVLLLSILIYLIVAVAACNRNKRAITKYLDSDSDIKPSLLSWACKFILFFSTLILTAFAAFLVPFEFSLNAFLVIGILMVVLLAWNRWIAVGVLRWIGGIAPASDSLAKIIEGEATKCGVNPLPAAWEMKIPMANAFALQTHHAVAFTSGALKTLTDREIAGITRHELAHLTESKKMRLLRALSPCCYFPILFIGPLASHGLFYVPVILVIVLLRLYNIAQRRMEKRADREAGGEDSEEDKQCYGNAILKLYKENLTPAVMAGNLTHPNLYDRLESLGIEPDFPRPAAPKRLWPTLLAAGYVILAGILLNLFIYFAARIWEGSITWE